ncbi:hypothetical protein BO78DRAFT_327588 [Aspergillus sclerotiicarbonarius CBS 121057]|uniref:Uncharacterized protein n=1 Tax=Aspergillus sclerotiicarbonarius (strain CBS 121057 / IBT 28362) TaxID=1448318 RepID=A0A319DUW1_ASPSB|nr:hypothetical protein BO78DRAFT_327588 [Aspergillus sclerotiicarbonarius CBS 121057]
MSAKFYCPFCGLLLSFDPYYADETTRRVRPWFAEVRGLYLRDPHVGPIAITGIGIISLEGMLRAPADSGLSYVNVDFEMLEEWGICKLGTTRWCFGVHNSCWRLLLLRLGHGLAGSPPNEAAIAESVFYQLYCTPCGNRFVIQVGHGHGGAGHVQNVHGIASGYVHPHMYADPSILATGHMLSQSYWRSRFLLGQEADFIFPTLTGTRDWSALFLGTVALMQAGNMPLINRRRIRHLLEPIAALVNRHDALRNGPGGCPYQPPIEGGSHLVIDGLSAAEPGNGLSRLVGYHNPGSEKWVEIPSTSHVATLYMAFCAEGLRGIGFNFTHSGSLYTFGEYYSQWARRGTLHVPFWLKSYHLLAELDHFKIVSLGLAEG